jgi:hypothetical protein
MGFCPGTTLCPGNRATVDSTVVVASTVEAGLITIVDSTIDAVATNDSVPLDPFLILPFTSNTC